MRKGFLCIFALTTLGLTSCGQDDENVQQTETKVSAKNDINTKFKEYVKSRTGKQNSSRIAGSVDYDLDHVYYNQEANAYYFLQKDFNFDSEKEQMAIFAGVDEKGEFSGLAEVGMSKTKDENFTIKYYDAEQALVSVDYSYNKEDNKIYFSNINNETEASRKNCGQGAASCIAGAYSNHGWMSVTLWVETAVIPETAIAVAGACVIKNCIVN